jgi:hypothetical protein
MDKDCGTVFFMGSKQGWLVTVEFKTASDLALPNGDMRVTRLNDWLHHAYGGGATPTPSGWVAKAIVTTGNGVLSIDEAGEQAVRWISHCLETLEFPRARVVSKSVIDADTFHAELDVVGSREVSDLIGVSRQRLLQLRQEGRLPEPDAQLAATPVWKMSTIEGFLWGWRRKPGPVPKTANAG